MKIKDIALLLLCSLIFSGSYIATKMIIDVVPPLSIAFLRTFIATICFLPFICRHDLRGLTQKKIIGFLMLGFFGVFLYNIAVFYALAATSATNVALINAANPIFTLIASTMLFNPIVSKRTFIAFFFSFLGVAIVITKGNFSMNLITTNTGDLVMILAMLSWVIYGLMITHLNNAFSPIFITFVANLVGSILLLPIALYDGVLGTVFQLTLSEWLPLLYIGIIATAVGFSLYSLGIKRSGPSTTTFVVFSMLPIFAAFLAYCILGRSIENAQIIGGILILVALAIGLIRRKKPIAPAHEPI